LRAREEKEKGRGKDGGDPINAPSSHPSPCGAEFAGQRAAQGGDGGVAWDRALVRPGWQADERAADGARAIPGPERPGETTGAAPPSPAAARAP
jgi:hypothetical protein